jgi:hypothetical protein
MRWLFSAYPELFCNCSDFNPKLPKTRRYETLITLATSGQPKASRPKRFTALLIDGK